jgi:hypothetical protein
VIRIEISKELHDKIAENGNYGETHDDVLRRLLGLQPSGEPPAKGYISKYPGKRVTFNTPPAQKS